MIKLIGMLKRKPGLTDEEFYRYWKEKHGPLGAKIVPGLRKCIQNHPIKLPGVKYEWDGIGEMWFDDLEAYQRFMAWRAGKDGQVLRDDMVKFADENSLIQYVVEEHVMK